MDYLFIRTDTEMKTYIEELFSRKDLVLAVDIEGEFNLHRYGEHLCLIQIYDGEKAVLVDPLVVSVEAWRPLFENPHWEKIIYDCSSDRTLLYRRYGVEIIHITDLNPAVKLLEYKPQNLNYVLNAAIGLPIQAKKEFQQYNWIRRPISTKALEYALDDVRYLHRLRDILLQQLKEKDLLETYQQENEVFTTRIVKKQGIPGVFKKNRFKKMAKSRQDLFKRLFEVREEAAKKADQPPNNIIPNEDLFRLVSGEISYQRMRLTQRIPSGLREKLYRQVESEMTKHER